MFGAMSAATVKRKTSTKRVKAQPRASATAPAPKPSPVKRTPAPKSPPAKRAPAKPARVPIAVVRLEQALAQEGEALQCAALHGQLAKLSRARATAASAAALAHTTTGTAVARAYLTAVSAEGDAPVAAADVVAKYCATLDRGRKAMRGAFVSTWGRASDLRAVDAAYKNFEREILDDPGLLVVGAEIARRLGHHGAAADRTGRLERARRLAPLVAELANEATRGRAAARLETVSPEDRRHVYARVVDAPRSFDGALAVAAIVGLADDPEASDMSLSLAIAELHDHGRDELVGAWNERVAAGDSGSITRLLSLFEWTALWATDQTQLEPFIRALHPAGHRADVFAQVDGGLSSESEVVREAVLEHWIQHGLAAFGDAQVDKLVRSAIAIAEEGNDTNDRRAANRALFHASHAGTRKALMDAIEASRTGRNDELRSNLYHGLSRLQHATIVPFLIKRLFVEREEYTGLLTALADKLDAATHRSVLTTLAERAREADGARAATAYAELLIDTKRSPRLLVDLARTLLGWQPRTTDDGRRLRYVFEQALVAALAIQIPDAARAFLARVRELPDRPFSDYRVVDRETRTPSPLADAGVQDQIAALESGKLEQTIAEARVAAEAARATGRPIPADDARLGALASCTVSSRFLDDRERSVVWFFDELGELHVYDGFSVGAPAVRVTGDSRDGIAPAGMAAFVGGKTIIDERVTCFDASLERAREVIRSGDRILVFDSSEGGGLRAIGIQVTGYIAARDAVARFAANPPPGMKRVDAWRGVRREYASSGGEAQLAIVGSSIDGTASDKLPPIERVHPDPQAAVKALQTWEGRLFAAGGRLVKISAGH